jgi:hypothetical protein
MIRVLSCLLAAVVITTTVPVARSDAPDDQFINSPAAQGITGNRGQLIADGQRRATHRAPWASLACYRRSWARLREGAGVERDDGWAAGVLPGKGSSSSSSMITLSAEKQIAAVRV